MDFMERGGEELPGKTTDLAEEKDPILSNLPAPDPQEFHLLKHQQVIELLSLTRITDAVNSTY